MDTIYEWIQELQKRVTFLNETVALIILTLLFWLIVAALLWFVLYALLHRITRRTDTDVDDVIMDTVSAPLLFIVLMLGLHDSLRFLPIADDLSGVLDHLLIIAVIIISAFTVRRLARNVGIYYGTRYALRTESNLDDVLLPIVDRVSPIIIYAIGAIVLLQYLGLNLETMLVAIGGTSFILAFALQDILSNIFSGISLVVDTPFGYHDLIVLADGKLCEVRRIGLRVTELYDVASHSIIYMPNSRLANEQLVNMTRPSPDLIHTIKISVNKDVEPQRIKETLCQVANGHPDVLGKIEHKLQHLDAFRSLESGEPKRDNGRARLKQEQEVDKTLGALSGELERLAQSIKRKEKNGWKPAELKELAQEFEPIMALVGIQDDPDAKDSRKKKGKSCRYAGNDDSLIAQVCTWINIWLGDPDLVGADASYRLEPEMLWREEFNKANGDRQLLVSGWGRRLQLLIKHVTNLRQKIADPRGVEQRLDDKVEDFANWLREHFKEPSPTWKEPDVNFLGWDDRGKQFGLEIFIDDILLEHFEREERVERELFAEISRTFREMGIEIAFPAQMLWVKSLPGSAPDTGTAAVS